jgi:transposase
MGKKAREKTQEKQLPENQARQRAEIIMKVRCGLMTATEAAHLLGVSRKTYYKWEQRGLAALLVGLQEQTGGRPEIPRQQKREVEVEKRLVQLQREKELLQKRMQLKDLVHQMHLQAEKDGAKKK